MGWIWKGQETSVGNKGWMSHVVKMMTKMNDTGNRTLNRSEDQVDLQ